METTMQVKAVKKGEYVRLKAGGPVYIRGDYCRESKKYSLVSFDDINREVFKVGTFVVHVGFTF